MTMTTHDLTMLRYTQEYVPPGDSPSGPTPVPPLADLQAALTVTDPSHGPAPSAPAPSSEQPAPVTLAAVLARLSLARAQVALAESEIAAVAAHLSGSN
jgi:hypothetical protein